MNLNLEGKSALVAGSTQGIGKASALQLAEMGASVVLLARNEEKLKAVKEELANNGSQNHAYIVADFSSPENVAKAIGAWDFAKNPIHILINNTGGPPGGQAIEANLDAYRQAFNSHLINNQILAQAVVASMKSAGYGRIINVISTSVKAPLANLGVSNTIRGAVANWSKTLANELGQFNITVNNVLPGATHTARLQQIAEGKAAKTGQSVEAIFEAFANQVPMKRVAQAEEVANAIAFLASPAASYINGINVPVDGGRTPAL